MIILFTGNGKGKTTAALGQAVRAIGRGKRVLMVQFIKGPWKSGEDFVDIVKKGDMTPFEEKGVMSPFFTMRKMGLGFVGILGDKLPFEDHADAAKRALGYIKSEFDNFDVIIMDEVNVAVDLKLITAGEVLEVLKNCPDEKIVLLTGRGAPQELIDRAELVTEMREVKHPFNDGKWAKKNIEF